MSNFLGFLLINVYAFLIIISTSLIFLSKKRLKQFEDETYKKFLIANIFISLSGLLLGFSVTSNFSFDILLIVILNKIYLICLLFWISILTSYFIHISLRNIEFQSKINKIFDFVNLISIILIFLLPLDVEITSSGAVASGLAIIYTYSVFAIGFLIQIIMLLRNIKNFKSIKYIPLYLLIVLGALVVITIIIKPSLNYIINPIFIFIAFVMYHTIENPDAQMNAILLRNNELTEKSVSDRANFLFKITQEMKVPIEDVLKKLKSYNNKLTKDEINDLILSIENDVNNAYFIINDISDVSAMDVKKINVIDNKYSSDRLFKDIEHHVKNSIKLSSKDIDFNFKVNNNYPKYLYGDNIKIRQVLLSIISNSIKYTDKGFIDLELDSIERYGACRFIFTIKDSGCGINLYDVNELLSSDASVDLKDFEKNDSLDLPIPIVIKIIKLLGGSISIKSEEGKGSIVVVTFDQKIADSDNYAQDSKVYNKLNSSKKRVLVVDDENLEKLESKLSKYDVDVISTIMGKECLDKIEFGDSFDLIIIKDELKDMSGFSVLKSLKSNKKFKTPVILCIKKDKEFIKDHFTSDGFSDVFVDSNIDNVFDDIVSKYI